MLLGLAELGLEPDCTRISPAVVGHCAVELSVHFGARVHQVTELGIFILRKEFDEPGKIHLRFLRSSTPPLCLYRQAYKYAAVSFKALFTESGSDAVDTFHPTSCVVRRVIDVVGHKASWVKMGLCWALRPFGFGSATLSIRAMA